MSLSRAASEKNSATSFWYAATVASKVGLDLEDVAVANLQKTADRWLHLSDGADFFDSAFPPHEQLPRHAIFEIVAVEHKGRPASSPR